MIDVPDVVGDSEAVASAALIGADLTVGNVTTAASATVPVGDVISQNPAACTDCATSGDPVDLVVSSGVAPPAMIDVPDVVGQPQAAAESMLIAADLTVGNVTQEASATVPAGDVISQSKGPCTDCATSGEAIDLVVSTGPAPPGMIDVPNVVGDSEAVASAALIGADLTVGGTTMQASATVPVGDVISQSKGPCTECATSGEAIDLVVSTGAAPPMIDVPDVVGQPEAMAGSMLVAADLTVGTTTQEASATVPAGDVISQSKGPCTACAVSQEAIDLVVSSGAAPPDQLPGGTNAISPFALAGLLMLVPWLRRRRNGGRS
jgi:beta-lactam-binding protein with PASTA domain